ncbi:hypothetical protein MPNT_20132 [Candidatus Methylacidithermus pantelleriae]|uniref:Uncharacterized protein n=1 Tax=Candidatus Methylacidithermus pantelleriae TaxID=2744239 RepID=A0A8J2BNI0_9BACT|nr:hypothetical protein MPNT_20132 [Candidatus Methylacidithermus pantelleriae]
MIRLIASRPWPQKRPRCSGHSSEETREGIKDGKKTIEQLSRQQPTAACQRKLATAGSRRVPLC